MIMLSELIPICRKMRRQHGNLRCTDVKGISVAPPVYKLSKQGAVCRATVCLSYDARYSIGLREFGTMLCMVRSEVTMDLVVVDESGRELLMPVVNMCHCRVEFECK